MSSRLRNVLAVFAIAAALGVSVTASAGVIDKAAAKLQEKKSAGKESKNSSGSFTGPTRPQRQASQPSGNDRARGGNGSSGNANRSRSTSGSSSSNSARGAFGRLEQDGSRNRGTAAGGSTGNSGSRDRNTNRDTNRDTSRERGTNRDLRDDLARLQGRSNDRDRSDHRDGGWRLDDRGHHQRRVVERLPSGYRDYYWNGSRYYFYGGSWYQPFGASYITVGAPYGLFVSSLPGYYSSFWYGDTRYFYSDDVYYVYEPVRRGYVVSPSPYEDEDEYYEDGMGDDLYVYPAEGQSEQQQADDRYDCHRWAVDQTGYNPLDDEYDADWRADYLRAMTACLTGRGYTVN